MSFSPEYKQTMGPYAVRQGDGEEGTLFVAGAAHPVCLPVEGRTMGTVQRLQASPNGLADVSGETEGAEGSPGKEMDSCSGVALGEGNPAHQQTWNFCSVCGFAERLSNNSNLIKYH